MIKIAINGKAGSGKDTFASILRERFESKYHSDHILYVSFADPIKEIMLNMFPSLDERYLWGPSELRSEVITTEINGVTYDHTNATGDPLTVRQVLLDLGKTGRIYNKDLWINIILTQVSKFKGKVVIITDQRMINEFERLSKENFIMIRIKRETFTKVNDISETEQDSILDSQYDFIVNNNEDIANLELQAKKIYDKLLTMSSA